MNGPADKSPEVMRIGELILLAALWMLFGFMVWYYASPWHGAPVRFLSGELLNVVLGDAYASIRANPDKAYEFLVETRIEFTFPDGSRDILGFLVNPLIFGYGLPLLFGLTMAANQALWHKLMVMVIGYLVILLVQVWGVFWESLKLLAFDFAPEGTQAVADAGVAENVVALCYQLGVLILPALAPVIVWVLGNREEIERFIEAGHGGRS